MFDIGAIWGKVKKIFTKREVFIILLLIVGYFATRLINLTDLPIFTDEGIYIRWAKVAWHDANWRFISLTDGRQPLQTWATIPFLKLFPQNALLAGRLFSVATGFGALVGLFSLLYYLFGKHAAFIGALFYILNPYFLFYDRMALADSSVNAGFVWMLFFSIILVRTLRLDTALLFGLFSGFLLLSKSTPKLFLITSVFAPFLIFEKKYKKFIFQSVNYYILFGIVLFLSTLVYNVQRLSPFFHYVAQKNTTFVMTFSELAKNPFTLLPHNLITLPQYVFGEMGWIFLFSGLAGLIMLWRRDRRLCLYLLIWLLVPYFTISLISRVVFPRYLIFLGTAFLIFTSFFLSRVKVVKTRIVFIVLILVATGYGTYSVLFSPRLLPFPPIDRGQYVEGVTAGWGLTDLMSFARTKSADRPVILLAEGNFGVIGDMLEATKRQSDTRISVRGYWPLEKESLLENQKELKDNFVYTVFAHRKEFPADWPIKLVKKYEKPGGKEAIYLYELLP